MSANGKFRMGLNVRKSVGAADGVKKTANIFGDESSDDEQQNAAEKFDKKYAASAGKKARQQRMVEKELTENPHIFDYDTHYEEIQQQRDQKVAAQKEADKEKKPKYAHLLTKAHKQRELNRLLVEENIYKKEREQEAGQFKDEEVFVTGAYRQQIEERERHKTEMEREEALEKIRDVRDQKMWQQAFNRTMLDNISRDPLAEEEKKDIKTEEEKDEQKMEGEGENELKKEVKEEQREEEEEEKSEGEKGKAEEEKRHGKGGDERRRDTQRGEKEEEAVDKRQRRQPTPLSKAAEREDEEERTARHRRRRERTEEREEGEKDSRGRGKEGKTETDDGRKRARKGDEKEKEEQQKQQQDEEAQRMARIRQVLAKRNDQNAVEEAKRRYLERRREGFIRAPRIVATE